MIYSQSEPYTQPRRYSQSRHVLPRKRVIVRCPIMCAETSRSFITLDTPQPAKAVLCTAIRDFEGLAWIPRSAHSVQRRNRTRSILSPQVRDVDAQLVRVGRRIQRSSRRIRSGWAFAQKHFGDFTVLTKVVIRPQSGEKLQPRCKVYIRDETRSGNSPPLCSRSASSCP